MEAPAAEWVVDEALVEGLVREQSPEHAGRVRWLAEGWDNAIFRVGEGAIARLPRRAAALPLVAIEHRWLPRLPELPLPIPRPIVCGAPSERFPHPWSLMPFIDGDIATGASLDPAAADTLGGFLRALHVPAPVDAPFNPFRGIPLAARSDRVEFALTHLANDVDADAVRRTWATLRDLAPPDPRVWLHGDLHPSNVLVQRGRPVAVIDFGDLCGGDRAIDLALGWMLFDGSTRERFFDAAEADAEARQRSRGWALCLGLAYAASGDADPPFKAMALDTVNRTTSI